MKRAFAMVLAVTLFFSFSVVGYADEQVTSPIQGEYLTGIYSLLDTVRVMTNTSSGWQFISEDPSFVMPVGSKTMLSLFAPSTDLQLLSPVSSYRFFVDVNVPFEPSGFSVDFYDTSGNIISKQLENTNYSYADGRLVVDTILDFDVLCRLRSFGIRFDGVVSSAFSGRVYGFSIANVDKSGSAGEVVSSSQFRGVYYTGDSFTATTGVFDNGQGVSVDNSILPSGSFTPIVTLKSDLDYYFSFTGRYSDVPIYNFYVYSSSGVVPVSTVVNEGYFRVTGVIESGSFSLSSPLTLYISSDNGNVFYFRFDSAEFIPVGSVSGAVGEVSGDVGLASFIGSFFSDMYDGLVGFFISREDADEDIYDEANNEELSGKIEEAYTASEQVDSFEQQMWTDLDTYSSDINPDSFSFGPEFISSMGWIAATWTDCFNGLGSWQSIITFPMFLGLAMLIIGRGSQAIDKYNAKLDAKERRELAEDRAAERRAYYYRKRGGL